MIELRITNPALFLTDLKASWCNSTIQVRLLRFGSKKCETRWRAYGVDMFTIDAEIRAVVSMTFTSRESSSSAAAHKSEGEILSKSNVKSFTFCKFCGVASCSDFMKLHTKENLPLHPRKPFLLFLHQQPSTASRV
ncbi:hypothetical protein Bca52824_026353 [Brassica carinata]|uniref:Uncharacterized protein n=1 Tax=Brassica carinata TaxID=52824 RepID=A0A8X7SHH5_BRACI|nr:hypothetical protein Bca52824_026353 [Brassica carinata]